VSSLSQPYLWNEQAARAKLEEIVWPCGPVCPYCGAGDRIGAVNGKGARAGLKFCCRCRKQFRATIGTLFEGSHVPLHKWFQACFLLVASNNAISAHRLHLKLEVTTKTALSMRHRIMYAMNGYEHYDQCKRGSEGSWTETFGRKQSGPDAIVPVRRSSCAGNTGLPDAAGNFDLPWTTAFPRSAARFPVASTRQFLAFLETARAFNCSQEDDRFDAALARLGRRRAEFDSEREILRVAGTRLRPDMIQIEA
jgi:hypothetical protein